MFFLDHYSTILSLFNHKFSCWFIVSLTILDIPETKTEQWQLHFQSLTPSKRWRVKDLHLIRKELDVIFSSLKRKMMSKHSFQDTGSVTRPVWYICFFSFFVSSRIFRTRVVWWWYRQTTPKKRKPYTKGFYQEAQSCGVGSEVGCWQCWQRGTYPNCCRKTSREELMGV